MTQLWRVTLDVPPPREKRRKALRHVLFVVADSELRAKALAIAYWRGEDTTYKVIGASAEAWGLVGTGSPYQDEPRKPRPETLPSEEVIEAAHAELLELQAKGIF